MPETSPLTSKKELKNGTKRSSVDTCENDHFIYSTYFRGCCWRWRRYREQNLLESVVKDREYSFRERNLGDVAVDSLTQYSYLSLTSKAWPRIERWPPARLPAPGHWSPSLSLWAPPTCPGPAGRWRDCAEGNRTQGRENYTSSHESWPTNCWTAVFYSGTCTLESGHSWAMPAVTIVLALQLQTDAGFWLWV
jgi:hypothetical protein